MSFTFDISVPATGHNPSVDYSTMQANNVSTSGILDVDHISFNALAGGTHKQSTYINESDPGQGQGNGVMYSNNATADGKSWPFWTNEVGTTQIAGEVVATATGHVTLTGGIIVAWGLATGLVQGNNNMPYGFTFPNAAFSISIQAVRGGTNNVDTIYVIPGQLSTNACGIRNTSGSITDAYFIVVGN